MLLPSSKQTLRGAKNTLTATDQFPPHLSLSEKGFYSLRLIPTLSWSNSMRRSIFKSASALSNASGQLSHMKPPSSTMDIPYLNLLQSCSSVKQLKQIHSHFITLGLVRFTYITSTLLPFCVALDNRNLNYAKSVFNQIDLSTVFNCNIMIQAYSKTAKPEMAILIYIKMRSNGVAPNFHTFPNLIKSCKGLSSVSQIHGHVLKFALDLDVYVVSSLIKTYSKYQAMELARRVFDETPNRNVVCWTSLITGYCGLGLVDEGWKVFDQMPERNDNSWSAMIAGYAQNDFFSEAIQLFSEFKCLNLKPNRFLMASVLTACAGVGAFEEGKWIHSYIEEHGHEYGIEVETTLIDFYAKCGSIEVAKQVFDKMPRKDVMAWSAMIRGLATNGYADFALKYFKEMEKGMNKPNAITFIAVLTACSHGRLVDEGWRLFESMTKDYGIFPRIEHYGCMVDLLGRAGRVKEAEQLISSMPMEPDAVIWGALLHGCMMHGYSELGESVGKHLIEIEPQHSGRYIHLANIYATMGRWENVLEQRSLMETRGVTTGLGWSSIEINASVHRFAAGEKSHPQLNSIYKLSNRLHKEMSTSKSFQQL